jgi:hypothetical protein
VPATPSGEGPAKIGLAKLLTPAIAEGDSSRHPPMAGGVARQRVIAEIDWVERV